MPSRARVVAQALAVGVVGALLALLAWRLLSEDEGAAGALRSGKTPEAYAFTLPRLDGDGALALADYRGQVVVLNFWASWCGPCKEEAPELEAAWRRWRDRGVAFVGVDAQDFRSDARDFVARYGITYPNVYDGKGSTLGRYGVTGFPETFFVSRSGKVVGAHQSPIDGEQLDEGIERALAAS